MTKIKRYPITKKYDRKIRLLVTNACSKNCNFCHNEGLPKSEKIHMLPNELAKILYELKRYSNRVILSGGEPLEYKYLKELLVMLLNYEFDITINTSLPKIGDICTIIQKITSIHISIFNMRELEEKELRILEIHDLCPTLQIVLNVPITNIEELQIGLERLYSICCKTNARIQLIRLFDITKREILNWEQRWEDVFNLLSSFKLSFLESTNREVSYITNDLIQIDLLEIPCVASGVEYGHGNCLNDSDISIDPNMQLSICRWNNNSIDIVSNGYNLDSVIAEAFRISCTNCIFGSINEFLYPDTIKSYMALPHYKWPPTLSESIDACNMQLKHTSISYYGKSGYIFQLENEFAAYFGVPYALAVSSGTAAIYLSCIALRLTSDDEVIIPTYTFPTVVTALISANVKIRVCDTDAISGNISIENFKQHINLNVKAVVITHLWGDPVDLEELIKICSMNNIKIIEDCSHAYGSLYKNKFVGTFGDIACFSTQANKAVFSGEGGMLITSDRELYERIIVFSSSQKRILDCVYDKKYRKFWESGLGLKLKMHPLGAPIALESLHKLNNTNYNRNLRVEIMNNAILSSHILTVPRNNNLDSNRVYYTYKPYLNEEFIDNRDKLVEKLILQGLDVTASSFIPLHKTPLMTHKQIIKSDEKFLNANMYYARIISFPAFVNEPRELIELYANRLINTIQHFSWR